MQENTPNNGTKSVLSRNVTQRHSSQNSAFLNLTKATDWREKERKLLEKIKTLKLEKRSLDQLLKDQEKAFSQRFTEQKKEIQNMQNLFKQIWPMIKSKVKDP